MGISLFLLCTQMEQNLLLTPRNKTFLVRAPITHAAPEGALYPVPYDLLLHAPSTNNSYFGTSAFNIYIVRCQKFFFFCSFLNSSLGTTLNNIFNLRMVCSFCWTILQKLWNWVHYRLFISSTEADDDISFRTLHISHWKTNVLCSPFFFFVIKATTGYWYVFRLSVRIASFLVWWLPMILRTYLQNFSPRNSFKWEIWPKNLKKSLFFHIHTPTSLFKLQKWNFALRNLSSCTFIYRLNLVCNYPHLFKISI